jgi:hypothetical protein
MPGHPEWTVNPVEQQAQARAVAPASRARRR